MATAARFAQGADEAALAPTLDALLAKGSPGRWALTPSGEGIERSFKFKTFAKTWDFMTAVALQCKIKNHHPEWSNVYNTTYIRWTTHSPQGLSALDVELAGICDALARDFGEQTQAAPAPAPATPQSGGQKPAEAETAATTTDSCQMRGLADAVASGAGKDCCVPKQKQ